MFTRVPAYARATSPARTPESAAGEPGATAPHDDAVPVIVEFDAEVARRGSTGRTRSQKVPGHVREHRPAVVQRLNVPLVHPPGNDILGELPARGVVHRDVLDGADQLVVAVPELEPPDSVADCTVYRLPPKDRLRNVDPLERGRGDNPHLPPVDEVLGKAALETADRPNRIDLEHRPGGGPPRCVGCGADPRGDPPRPWPDIRLEHNGVSPASTTVAAVSKLVPRVTVTGHAGSPAHDTRPS